MCRTASQQWGPGRSVNTESTKSKRLHDVVTYHSKHKEDLQGWNPGDGAGRELLQQVRFIVILEYPDTWYTVSLLVFLRYFMTVDRHSLLTHPKLQNDVHHAPTTTNHAVSPPSGGASGWSTGDKDFSLSSDVDMPLSSPRGGRASRSWESEWLGSMLVGQFVLTRWMDDTLIHDTPVIRVNI